MTATVRISWIRDFENNTYWNEVCAWAIEHYGLPGDRFVTHANVENMEFEFANSKDALLMCLRWNAQLLEPTNLESV
jgi:hypothetical protein